MPATNDNPVTSDNDAVRIRLGRCGEARDLDLQTRNFFGTDGRKTRVLRCGIARHLSYRLPQRATCVSLAQTAPQHFSTAERDENRSGFVQHPTSRWLLRLTALGNCLEGFASIFEQSFANGREKRLNHFYGMVRL